MGDVKVPYGDDPQETAVLLLAAAQAKGYDADVVVTSEGAFHAPEDVVSEAGVEYESDDGKAKPAKKAAAKKTTAKKAAAKKTAKKE